MPSINTNLLLIAFAVVFIVISLLGFFGIWKNWYWQSPRRVYPYLPLGFLFLLATFDTQLRKYFSGNEWIVTVIYGAIMAVVIWFTVAPPKAIKPKWVRIIEEHPPQVYTELAHQAKHDQSWRNHVRDEQSLRLWIEQARKKPARKKA
jgi:hypothetical protein